MKTNLDHDESRFYESFIRSQNFKKDFSYIVNGNESWNKMLEDHKNNKYIFIIKDVSVHLGIKILNGPYQNFYDIITYDTVMKRFSKYQHILVDDILQAFVYGTYNDNILKHAIYSDAKWFVFKNDMNEIEQLMKLLGGPDDLINILIAYEFASKLIENN